MFSHSLRCLKRFYEDLPENLLRQQKVKKIKLQCTLILTNMVLNEFLVISNKISRSFIFDNENFRAKPRLNEHRFHGIPHYIEQKYWFPLQILSWI